jgi:hypothetical protein
MCNHPAAAADAPRRRQYNAETMGAWWKKWWWRLAKALITLGIVFYIGRQFARDLSYPGLWERSFGFGWLLLSGALYLPALGGWAFFWYRLLRAQGQDPTPATAARAYYVGLMGKYAPFKAWALVMRALLVRGPRVHVGVAGVTAFYEVLTTMATGVLVALVLFVMQVPAWFAPWDWDTLGRLLRADPEPDTSPLDPRILALLALGLLVPLGIPILPPVYNRLMGRLARRFQPPDAPALPRLRLSALGQGVAVIAVSWFLMGASLLAVLQAVLDRPPPLTWASLQQHTALIGLGYVAGFTIFFIPAAIGVREQFLKVLLVPELVGDRPGPTAALVAVLLRLVWTTAEFVMVAVVYWFPSGKQTKETGN